MGEQEQSQRLANQEVFRRKLRELMQTHVQQNEWIGIAAEQTRLDQIDVIATEAPKPDEDALRRAGEYYVAKRNGENDWGVLAGPFGDLKATEDMARTMLSHSDVDLWMVNGNGIALGLIRKER